MSSKRVLVVDDSRTALLTLRKMLEKQGIEVDMAESAQAALDYLRYQRPDAIFMDHMMPGMDGFEAVRHIKDNSETATIPIMMYTTKAGEMYVSQARALGAVGVLPKEVKPAELFNVLCSLGIADDQRTQTIEPVVDRRRAAASAALALAEDDPPPPAAYYDLDHAEQDIVPAPPVSGNRAITLQMKRLLEEQRNKIKEDLNEAGDKLSHEVSRHLTERGLLTDAEKELAGESARERRSRWRDPVLVIALMLACVWLYNIYYQEKTRTSELEQKLAQLQISSTAGQSSDAVNNSAPVEASGRVVSGIQSNNLKLLPTVEWALNLASEVEYDKELMNDETARIVDDLVTYLTEAGFRGTLLLRGHVGEFCLKTGGSSPVLPGDSSPASECQVQFLSEADAATLGSQQSIAFANYVASEAAFESGLINLEIESAGNSEPIKGYPSPWAIQTAGEWNRIARANNRLEIRLIPEGENL